MPILSALGGDPARGYGLTAVGKRFKGGDFTTTDLLTMTRFMSTAVATAPTTGGNLVVNNVSLGVYDWHKRTGAHTISSFTATDYFTTTQDSRSAFVIFDNNLTINNGITFTPSVRKLFLCMYVKGNLTLNGSISMTSRGANHSSSGGSNLAAGTIRLANGTYSSVSNPEVPAAGAASNASGTAGQSGGGGHGSNGFAASGAAGTAGTAYTGGTGGSGGSDYHNGNPGTANGGPGGCQGACGNGSIGGGAGNPGGCGCGHHGDGRAGSSGTGGTIIIFVNGTFSGAGSVVSNGVNGGINAPNGPGGGSGGGSITIFARTDSGPTPTSSGGTHRGGSGTARKLSIVAS